jgi:RNA polymerase sigma factor (sigma-70 family)
MSPPDTITAVPTTPASDHTQWFKQEVQPHDGILRNYLRLQFPSVRDLDDVVQESYLQIWKARQVRSICSAKSYLFTVARHIAIALSRRERRAARFEEPSDCSELALDHSPGTVEILSQKEKLALIADAIATLPDRMREIVLLHKADGFSQRAVAEKLGISEKTVENLVSRGIARCRAHLRERGVEYF